jgi:hypothetical protein
VGFRCAPGDAACAAVAGGAIGIKAGCSLAESRAALGLVTADELRPEVHAETVDQ